MCVYFWIDGVASRMPTAACAGSVCMSRCDRHLAAPVHICDDSIPFALALPFCQYTLHLLTISCGIASYPVPDVACLVCHCGLRYLEPYCFRIVQLAVQLVELYSSALHRVFDDAVPSLAVACPPLLVVACPASLCSPYGVDSALHFIKA